MMKINKTDLKLLESGISKHIDNNQKFQTNLEELDYIMLKMFPLKRPEPLPLFMKYIDVKINID